MLSLSVKATQDCWPYHGESECYIILACGLTDPEPSEKSAESQSGRYCSKTQITTKSIGVRFPIRSAGMAMIGVQW